MGLIAEDQSDVEAIKVLIRRITKKENIGFKYFVGGGCGKLRRKAKDWAEQLKSKGCEVLVLIHDLDKNQYSKLHDNIKKVIFPFVIKETFICIPIEEMEAWFLADEKAIMKALNLKKCPKVYHKPEDVISPKEVLELEVDKASANTKIYLNTRHNSLIAKCVNIEILRKKCVSFKDLYNFSLAKI